MIRSKLTSQFIAILALFGFLSLLPAVQAADNIEPQKLIQTATENMLQALKDNKQELADNPDVIFPLVQKIVMPNFDFEKMSKLALGKNWRNASAEQKERFIQEFELLLVRTYSTALLEYTNEEIRFDPFNDDLKKKKVKVQMEVIQPGGPSIPMTFSMYLNKSTGWKVYDVQIDGISLVTNYRSTFANKIREEGMDKLIADLASRNAKAKS